MLFSSETTQQLRGFLTNTENLATFYAWVISAADDADLPQPERDAMGLLRLLVLESDEGLRPLGNARDWVAHALAEPESLA